MSEEYEGKVRRAYNATPLDIVEELIEDYYECSNDSSVCDDCKRRFSCDIALYAMSLEDNNEEEE